ncbi:DUF4288 domain-containing protein [bacterium]|nr:DUF4288 domain-containing protein [bacterium]
MESSEPQLESLSAEGTGGPGVITPGDAGDDNPEPWYSARCVFLLQPISQDHSEHLYEERVVLLRAETFDEAFEKAEKEAKDYIAGDPKSRVLFVEVYHLFERKIGDKVEIFSLIRDSPLSPQDYVSQFFDTGKEHRQRD